MSFRGFIQTIESYLFGVRLHTYNSAVHGRLEVWLINGKLVLNSQHANQSYDSLHEVFRHCFEQIRLDAQPVHHVLLLGLGVGSVPAIIEEELMMNCMVTAVENDPMMLEIGKHHFNINRFKHLRIIKQDAFTFVQSCKWVFEVIVIDLFADDNVPEAFTQETFLKTLVQLMETDGILLFNFIVKNKGQEQQFNNVVSFFKQQEDNIRIFTPVTGNKVICWQKSR